MFKQALGSFISRVGREASNVANKTARGASAMHKKALSGSGLLRDAEKKAGQYVDIPSVQATKDNLMKVSGFKLMKAEAKLKGRLTKDLKALLIRKKELKKAQLSPKSAKVANAKIDEEIAVISKKISKIMAGAHARKGAAGGLAAYAAFSGDS